MHSHLMPKLEKQSIAIEDALDDCEDKLSSLMFIVQKQRWQQLSQYVQAYEHAINHLQSHMQHQDSLPTELLHQFQYLSTQQRRVMRIIHQHMQQTVDDLQSIDQGIAKLRQTAQLEAS